MTMRILKIVGSLILMSCLIKAGVELIQSGPSPFGWRELLGIFAIGGGWKVGDTFVDLVFAPGRDSTRHR